MVMAEQTTASPGSDELLLSPDDYALLQSVHEAYRLPALARGIVKPMAAGTDGEVAEELETPHDRPKTRSGRDVAWSQEEQKTVQLRLQVEALRAARDAQACGKGGPAEVWRVDAGDGEVPDIVGAPGAEVADEVAEDMAGLAIADEVADDGDAGEVADEVEDEMEEDEIEEEC